MNGLAPSHRIAVIDDGHDIDASIQNSLFQSGYKAVSFASPSRFLATLHFDTWDAVLLDWMMPKYDGLQLLNQIKSIRPEVPVLMISSHGADQDIVAALDAGADEYIVKPVSDNVLVARLRAMIKLSSPFISSFREEIKLGDYVIAPHDLSVKFGNDYIFLTNREFSLARLFFVNINRPLSRIYILDHLWGTAAVYQSRSLDTHVARLRAKLKLSKKNGLRLTTLYGFGYQLESTET
jgi:DNA-binding response OmpR family regulator